jgi:predicted 2-oxoglutarate/Fe(II)-dependent dioxygenase YbiX/peroxiredoxin
MSSAPAPLGPGDYAPWFRTAALSGSPNYVFDTVAGRHVVLLLFGSARPEVCAAALATVLRHRALFDDANAALFGVTCDPDDAASGRIAQQLPGIRFFLDYDKSVSGLFGAAVSDDYRPHWLVLDKELRVLRRFAIDQGESAMAFLTERVGVQEDKWAPVISVPEIFEPELCRRLIALYEESGGEPSGFMRDIDGKTTHILDDGFKRRKDYAIADEALQKALSARLHRRLVPAIERAFQFKPTRIERYIVACYEAGAGWFRAHRDNTTLGTAHRRFAVTINLNSDEYEGGDLRFPEFGGRAYRAPTGGAVVFSCSLLHEALPVTKGRRYAFLPFLYDEAAAKIREENRHHIASAAGG